MDPDKKFIDRIREIFNEARTISTSGARVDFLKEAVGGDGQLAKEVESLLEADKTSCDFLSHDASGGALMDFPDLIGTMVDNYRLVELIGEGGFGEIYRTEETEPLRREVALKIIKPGTGTKNVIARFESERQALARMNHPNIAQVFDAGATESGLPFFVMELVHGIPIIDYCDQHKLSLPDQIHLFRKVCNAVHHAHQNGILHCDLKPSNILVSDQDGEPLPKIIDFGVAKSLAGRLTEHTPITQQEILIGTPMYMSPEQLKQGFSDIDKRSDIYSLGVILYELITGVTPLEPKTLTMAGMRQALNEDAPPRPSTRLHTLEKRTTVIANRGEVKPHVLEKLLRRDLDWIVLKAIEKDRDRRYDDVMALSDDLKHYLKHETVTARPPNLPRRGRNFVWRHRNPTVVVASVGITLFFGICITAISFLQLTKKPIPIIQKLGWKIDKFYDADMDKVNANEFGLRPDGSVLIVGDSGTMPKGLYWAKEGRTWSEADAFSIGEDYTDPEAMIELPDGIYVTVNDPRNRRGKILKVSPEGGKPEILCDLETIRNPHTLLVAPEGFDGPNVDPGDLLVFDLNGPDDSKRSAVWAVNRTSGASRPLITMEDNPLERGFHNGCFSPDGTLYASFPSDESGRSGVSILRMSPEGNAEVILRNFCFPHILRTTDIKLAAHPVTGELFFSAHGVLFAFFPGKTDPRHILSSCITAMRWAPDGSKLYFIADMDLWTLSGPDIATQPVSIEKTDDSQKVQALLTRPAK